jgi:hypothetical protein
MLGYWSESGVFLIISSWLRGINFILGHCKWCTFLRIWGLSVLSFGLLGGGDYVRLSRGLQLTDGIGGKGGGFWGVRRC